MILIRVVRCMLPGSGLRPEKGHPGQAWEAEVGSMLALNRRGLLPLSSLPEQKAQEPREAGQAPTAPLQRTLFSLFQKDF